LELTIPAALASAASQFGDSLAISEPGGHRVSYGELHDQVVDVAAALAAAGVEVGDRVAIWSPNTRHWVIAALAAQIGRAHV